MKRFDYKLTLTRLREVLSYDPATGHFTWKRAAKRAGTPHGDHRRLMVDGEFIYEHVLAWFYCHGVWPSAIVDHRDVDGSNNRIDNLRLATVSVNALNRSGPNSNNQTTGMLGVGRHGSGFRAVLTVRGRTFRSSVQRTPEAAADLYLQLRDVHASEVSCG